MTRTLRCPHCKKLMSLRLFDFVPTKYGSEIQCNQCKSNYSLPHSVRAWALLSGLVVIAIAAAALILLKSWLDAIEAVRSVRQLAFFTLVGLAFPSAMYVMAQTGKWAISRNPLSESRDRRGSG